MKQTALDCVIPVPASLVFSEGTFALSCLQSVFAPGDAASAGEEILRTAASFGIFCGLTDDPDSSLRLKLDPSLGAESWKIRVEPSAVSISGGDKAGLFYAVAAFTQMLAAASSRGPSFAKLECGTVCDSPRFSWRGFMLDSARHFQSVETVKAVIRLMAHFRLNVFHWHLTDNQGWRIGTGIVSPETSRDALSPGRYSREDLLEVAAWARRHFVRIVPEVDIPGHSKGLVQAYPQFACNPAEINSEICIGHPDVKAFLKKIYAELFEIFPDSRYIHFGGDEAETSHWEKCPRCREAMKKGGFTTMRELENSFMVEMTRFAVEHGRTPVVWGTGTGFPSDTVVQAWLDIREPLKHAAKGSKVIASVHNSYYFDYPADLSEPHETWMFGLQPENVYMADPYVIWEKQLKESMLGPEACLWTETVPEWRTVQKILPRIGAYAECAWSRPEQKEWYSFLRRKNQLLSAGYEDFLRLDIREK